MRSSTIAIIFALLVATAAVVDAGGKKSKKSGSDSSSSSKSSSESGSRSKKSSSESGSRSKESSSESNSDGGNSNGNGGGNTQEEDENPQTCVRAFKRAARATLPERLCLSPDQQLTVCLQCSDLGERLAQAEKECSDEVMETQAPAEGRTTYYRLRSNPSIIYTYNQDYVFYYQNGRLIKKVSRNKNGSSYSNYGKKNSGSSSDGGDSSDGGSSGSNSDGGSSSNSDGGSSSNSDGGNSERPPVEGDEQPQPNARDIAEGEVCIAEKLGWLNEQTGELNEANVQFDLLGSGLGDYFVALEKNTSTPVSAACDAIADSVATVDDVEGAIARLEAVIGRGLNAQPEDRTFFYQTSKSYFQYLLRKKKAASYFWWCRKNQQGNNDGGDDDNEQEEDEIPEEDDVDDSVEDKLALLRKLLRASCVRAHMAAACQESIAKNL